MHIEFIVEDSSGKKLLEILLPKILGEYATPHTWRSHAYKGIGKLPADLASTKDPSKRILLEQLPRLLQGYGKTAGIDAVVVVLDNDRRDYKAFLKELNATLKECKSPPKVTLFRIAIEEVEAWYLGDQEALRTAFPSAKTEVLRRYRQDSICNTWELLADAVYPGGAKAIREIGWPLPGQVKHQWAEEIGPFLVPARNLSPSFQELLSGLLRITSGSS